MDEDICSKFYKVERPAGKNRNPRWTCLKCKHKFSGAPSRARSHVLKLGKDVGNCMKPYSEEEKACLRELEDAAVEKESATKKRKRSQVIRD
jgi:transposase-like protein